MEKNRKKGGLRTSTGGGGSTSSSSNDTTIPVRNRTEYDLLSTTNELLDEKRKESDQLETYFDQILNRVTLQKKGNEKV